MNNDYANFSDNQLNELWGKQNALLDDLNKEKDRRKQKRIQELRQKRSECADYVLSNVDFFLEFCNGNFVRHNRQNCSDKKPVNWEADENDPCPRCVLLRAKEEKFMVDGDIIEFSLSVRRVSDEEC